jgi:serine protease Do
MASPVDSCSRSDETFVHSIECDAGGEVMNKKTVLAALVAGVLMVATPGAVASEPGNLRRTPVVEVVEKTRAAVVNISASRIISQRVSAFGDPFNDRFGPGQIIQREAGSLGSGFIIHPDGYVVTNNHVVDRARQITVELSDGRKLPAELLSADAEADLAILRIQSDAPLPALEAGDSGDLLIGEPVIAVGNPLGFSHSVSTGIISAVHRDLKDDGDRVLLADVIQTDAAINPGNSGGPLLNMYGQVIGINTAIRGDAQNIGFAIPVNRLRDLVPDLMNPAQITKVNIGIRLAERRSSTPPSNVTTTVTLVGDAGAKSIRSIAGAPVKSIFDAYAALLKVKPNSKFVVAFADDSTQEFSTTQQPLPDAVVQAREKLGMTIEQNTPAMSVRLGLRAEDGLFVTEVSRNSIADRAGLRPGDVIVSLGRYQVNRLEDLAALLPHLPTTGRVRIGIVRGSQMGYGVLQF